MKNLSAENTILLAIAKLQTNEDVLHLIENQLLLITDWEGFYYRAVKLGLGAMIPSVFQKINKPDLIPAEILSRFQAIYHRSLARNILLYEHFRKIQHAFSENSIPVIPLKGICFAESFYHDIGLRQMSDIDLLVKEKDTEACLKILSVMGFVTKERTKSEFIKTKSGAKHLPTMVFDDVMVEIHYRVPIDNTTGAVVIDSYWQHATPLTLSQTQTLALSPEDLLQYLCIHLERHFNEGKIQLYQFADLLILLQKYQQNIDWELFEKSCLMNDCNKNVSKILFLLQRFFSVKFEESVLQTFYVHNKNEIADLFVYYLNCDEQAIQKAIGFQNVRNLRRVEGFGNRIRYVLHDLFPSRSFMYQRYRIKYKPLLVFYYFKRFFKGLGLLFRLGRK